jgi:hypothetical protein
VWISEQTATFALYVINRLVFITAVESVYGAVRTDCLYKADYVSYLKGHNMMVNTDTSFTLCTNYESQIVKQVPIPEVYTVLAVDSNHY